MVKSHPKYLQQGQIGLLYRKYYKFSDQTTLLQLYISLVRLHLEYSAAVWDPHLQRHPDARKNTKVCL